MKYTLNLASASYINRRRLYAGYAAIGLVLFGFLCVNLVTLMRSSARMKVVETRLLELRGESSVVDKERGVAAAEVSALARKIDFANDLLVRDSFRWTQLLDQLEAHLASGVSIRGLQPDYRTGVLKLNGVAETIGDLRHFLDNLTTSKTFFNVYLKEQHTERSSDELSGGIVFSIELQRRGGA